MTGNDKWRNRRQINRTFALVILYSIKMLQFEGNNNDKIDLSAINLEMAFLTVYLNVAVKLGKLEFKEFDLVFCNC